MSTESSFVGRHIGLKQEEAEKMIQALGQESLDAFIDTVVPQAIRLKSELSLPSPLSEDQALAKLQQIMGRNRVLRSFLGLGYHDTFTPPVIQRNILENPGWYTAYTPYQAEISQGRLEALLNFQTMICDLTGLDVANASLLDEGTAVAEACAMALGAARDKEVWLSPHLHSHVLGVVATRFTSLGIVSRIVDLDGKLPDDAFATVGAVVVSYPDTLGRIHDFRALSQQVHAVKGLVIASADLLSLTLLTPPGEWGADICVGNSQRFGVPLGCGGPHAAFMAVRDALKRKMPGRLVGVSKDSAGRDAYRLSLQTREQHIRREKATSNICTAQVLLAVMASMYAVWHGPDGLKAIASRIHERAVTLASLLKINGFDVGSNPFFDTIHVKVSDPGEVLKCALDQGFNLRVEGSDTIVIALDELTTSEEVETLVECFVQGQVSEKMDLASDLFAWPADFWRASEYLKHPHFHQYRSETEMMRYLKRLENRDIALNRSMIPLGSCTMKLNAAAEMLPLTWESVGRIHPYAPEDQKWGYQEMLAQLEDWLAVSTGFAAVSFQPNAGSQGEYAGLLAIRAYFEELGQTHRNICLIPVSAHGTNPASAAMAGWKVVPVQCDEAGNIDREDLTKKIASHRENLATLMVTYPSTHGVFEEGIIEICQEIHEAGGQVYMDGANMNAQLGLTSPGFIGADVCHLNLHKTFCIPHGGGGPGVGPIGVASHLVKHLPGHELSKTHQLGAVSSAEWGSASICTISWMYIAMMGNQLVKSTEAAILAANYIAQRLDAYFPILFKGRGGFVAHECILDLRGFKKVSVEDVAKRLMDFGFHAPTMSWPVAGTLMVEPTESESKQELDRFCEAMIQIFKEIQKVEQGQMDAEMNPLKLAPHTAEILLVEDWNLPYSRMEAAFPLPWVKDGKYWPPVSRIDNVYGDRNLICTCPSVSEYGDELE